MQLQRRTQCYTFLGLYPEICNALGLSVALAHSDYVFMIRFDKVWCDCR